MYRLRIPAWVESDLKKFKAEEPAHFRSLSQKLADVSANPQGAGIRTRPDLPGVFHILLGGYMMFYVIAEDKREVRFFDIRKVFFSW